MQCNARTPAQLNNEHQYLRASWGSIYLRNPILYSSSNGRFDTIFESTSLFCLANATRSKPSFKLNNKNQSVNERQITLGFNVSYQESNSGSNGRLGSELTARAQPDPTRQDEASHSSSISHCIGVRYNQTRSEFTAMAQPDPIEQG